MTDQNFKEFTQLALRTESKIDTANINLPAFINLLKLNILVGTLLDFTKKGIYYSNYEKYDKHYSELVSALNDQVLTFAMSNGDSQRTENSELDYRLIHGLLGAVTEASELTEHLLNYVDGGYVDKAGIGEEFSDSDWYKAIAFDHLGLDEAVCRDNVINKLRIRFPDAYSDESAADRDLKAEREQLEKDIK